MRWTAVACVTIGVSLLGCSGIVEKLTESMQQGVQTQVEKVDARIQAEVRAAMNEACVKQAGDSERVRSVCTCVADQILAAGDPQAVLAKLENPQELARPYVEKCGPLILAAPEPPTEAPAEPAAVPATPPGATH